MTQKSKIINGVPVVRELDILIVELYSKGKRAKDIADMINKKGDEKYSSRTIENRLESLRMTFRCANTYHLIGEFFRNGLINI